MEGQDNGLSIVNVGKIVYVRVEDKSFLRRMEIFNIAVEWKLWNTKG